MTLCHALMPLALVVASTAIAQVLPSDPGSLPARLPVQESMPDPFAGKLLSQEAFAKEAVGVRSPAAGAVVIRKRVAPDYPYLLVRTGDDPANPEFRPMRDAGNAEISVIVGKDGKPRLVSVRKASRDSFGLNSAEAALQWEFDPLVIEGAPTEFQIVIPFTFKPVDEPTPGTRSQLSAPPPPPPSSAPTPDPEVMRLPLP